MKILVTGGGGQLGSELKALSERCPEWSFAFTDIPEMDITDRAAVRRKVCATQPQFVINCAAYTAVDKAQSDPQTALLLNATAVQNIADACREAGAYLIHISTDYVFDGTSHLPYRESDAVSPQSVYGTTKMQGEQAALAYEKGLVVRTAWLYSVFGNNFVKTMLRLGAEKDCIRVVADQIGTPTYAADLAAALFSVIEQAECKGGLSECGLFHFSNEGVCSWYDFATAVMRIAGLQCRIIPCDTADYPTAAPRPAYSVLHKGKIKRQFGIDIPHWQEALERCLAAMPPL